MVCAEAERRGRQNARVGQRLDRVNRPGGRGKKREKAGNERESARDRVRTVHGKEKAMRARERRNGAAGGNTASVYCMVRYFNSRRAFCP